MNKDSRQMILNRLDHVNLIFSLRHQFTGRSLIQHFVEDGVVRGAYHPWTFFDALIYYLLLTCFDLLGQSPEWVPFTGWLESKRKAVEREEAVKSIPDGSNPVDIARHLNSRYQASYGVRLSFNRFILDILTEEERATLYSSIRIVRGRMGGDPNTSYPALGYVVDEKSKLEFLFNLRNKFTHNAVIMGSPAAGISPVVYEGFAIDGKLEKVYSEIHREAKNGEWLSYTVRDWAFVLKSLVESALARQQTIHNSA